MAPASDLQEYGADGSNTPEGSEHAVATAQKTGEESATAASRHDSRDTRSQRRRRSVVFALRDVVGAGLKDDIDVLAFEGVMPLTKDSREGELAALMSAKASVEAAQQELSRSIGRIQEHLCHAGEHLARASGETEATGSMAQVPGSGTVVPSCDTLDTLDSLPSVKSNLSPKSAPVAPVAAQEARGDDRQATWAITLDGLPTLTREEASGGDRQARRSSSLDSLQPSRCEVERDVEAPLVGAYPSVEHGVLHFETYNDDHCPGKTQLGAVSSGGCPHAVNAETLPDTWPGSLEIRWAAKPSRGESSSSLVASRKQYSRRRASINSGTDWESEQDVRDAARKRRFVIHPNESFRMMYDLLSALLLTCDVVVIPWSVAWDVVVEGGLYYVALTTTLFWTLDVFMSFITGYAAQNTVVLEPRAIMWNYLRTWFCPDTAIVLCDWLSLVFATTPGLRTLRLAKIGRLLRLLALFRMIKLARALSDFIDEKLSDFAQVTVRVLKMICITLAGAHVISCIWFFIGRSMPSDTGMRWTDSRDLLEESMWYQYTTSLHWAMSQLTLGAVELVSSTIAERVFSIVCLLIGLLFGSSFVSSLSATMLEVQMDRRETHQKMQLLRRYLRESKVDRSLAARVERQLGERLVGREKIKEEQVKGLELLSSSLRSELRFHLCSPYLKSHSLFQLWISIDAKFVMHFCGRCMEFVHLRTQDDLFLAGKAAERAYFFISGSIRYTQEPQSSPLSTTRTEDVVEGRWMAEAALWSQWIHVGTANATQYSEVASIHAANIYDVIQHTTTIAQLSSDYCRKFHQRLQAATPPKSGWPDDLKVPLTDWSEMVPALDSESQVIVGLESIRHAYTIRRLWLKGSLRLDKLTQEVKEGKSSVMLNGQELERVASIVALKICNEAGQFLVQIGKEASGSMRPACQLPGGKQGNGELPADTMERVLEDKMSQIRDHVEVSALERHVEIKESQEFGVRTKYLRHIVISKLECLASLEESMLPEVTWERILEIAASGQRSFDGQTSWLIQDTPSLNVSMMSDRVTRVGSWHSRIKETARALCQRPVFCMQDNRGGHGLYAWFNEEEYAKLKSPMGEKLLPMWLATQRIVSEDLLLSERTLSEPPAQQTRTGSGDLGENAGLPRSDGIVVQARSLDFAG